MSISIYGYNFSLYFHHINKIIVNNIFTCLLVSYIPFALVKYFSILSIHCKFYN